MKTIRSGVIYNTIYQVLLIIVPLVTSPYLSRVIGAEGIGEYQFRYSIAYYFFLFAMLGVNTYGNREVAKCRESKVKRSIVFWQIFYIQLFTSLVFSVVYVMGGRLFSNSLNAIYYIQVIQILSACVDVNWYAFALEEFKLTTIRSIIMKLLTTLAIFGLVKTKNDLIMYSAIALGGNFVGLCMIMPFIFRTTYYQKPDVKEIKKHLKPNFVLFLPSVASSVYTYMDKVMLGFLSDNSEVGFYNYAENIVAIPNAVTNALSTVMLPRISNMIAHNELKKSKKYLNVALIYVSGINVALMFGIIAVSDIFVPWYLGSEYAYTAYLVKVRAALIVLNGVSMILRTQWLIPMGKDKEYTLSIVSGAVLNACLNTFLIYSCGAVGASMATVVAFVLICVIQLYHSKEAVIFAKLIFSLIIFSGFGVVMLKTINIINVDYLNNTNTIIILFIDMLVGGIIYLGLSGIYLYFAKIRISTRKDI